MDAYTWSRIRARCKEANRFAELNTKDEEFALIEWLVNGARTSATAEAPAADKRTTRLREEQGKLPIPSGALYDWENQMEDFITKAGGLIYQATRVEADGARDRAAASATLQRWMEGAHRFPIPSVWQKACEAVRDRVDPRDTSVQPTLTLATMVTALEDEIRPTMLKIRSLLLEWNVPVTAVATVAPPEEKEEGKKAAAKAARPTPAPASEKRSETQPKATADTTATSATPAPGKQRCKGCGSNGHTDESRCPHRRGGEHCLVRD